MRTHNPQYARSEYHTQLAKMSFDKIFDLTAGVYFNFYNIYAFGVWAYILEHGGGTLGSTKVAISHLQSTVGLSACSTRFPVERSAAYDATSVCFVRQRCKAASNSFGFFLHCTGIFTEHGRTCGSGQEVFEGHGSGRVGSGQEVFKLSRFRPGRVVRV